MEKAPAFETFIISWNAEFPFFNLTVADLKNPHKLMGALFEMFKRLGLDKDSVLTAPPESERDEHTTYYWDLLPVINMTRVINHVIPIQPHFKVKISHFLQPTTTASYSLLSLLCNWMVFNEERVRLIKPYQEELFARSHQLKILEDRKNELVGMLNEQAVEQVKRVERIKKLKNENPQLEQELKQEKGIDDEDKQQFEEIVQENKQLDNQLLQYKTQRDALVIEVERRRAQRVLDADDIRSQVEQAAQNVQEAELKVNSLKETLRQKDASLRNLQVMKPTLDSINNLVHETMKICENSKELASGDLETDSAEGELQVLQTEMSELQPMARELLAARALIERRRHEGQAGRHHAKLQLQRELKEVEEKDRQTSEICGKASQSTEKIKDLILKYRDEKDKSLEELQRLKMKTCDSVKVFDEALLAIANKSKKSIEDKCRDQRITRAQKVCDSVMTSRVDDQ